jgi:N-acetylmuramoyl-L-alanine amidase CwlA
MYKITKKLQTNNRTYKKFNPMGIVVHETATPGAADDDESRYFDTTTRKASVHTFIGWDSITQKIPFDEVAWHAGHTANQRYLGFELCRPEGHDEVKFKQVWQRAVWCFAYVFINHVHETYVSNLTLPSHADCARWWHETDHTDPEGYFAEYGKNIENFRAAVQQEIEMQLGIDPKKKPEIIKLIVTASVLNCRKGPGTQFGIIKQFIKGDYVTATNDVNGWWKLDINGIPGYIYGKYTTLRDR